MKVRFNDPDLKIRSLTIKFLRDGKIIAKCGDDNFHYTLHPGHNSGIVDLHRTDERFPMSDPRRYETLGAVTKNEIEAELAAIGPNLIVELMNLWRPLRLGWMIRRGLGIGARLPTDLELNGVNAITVERGPSDCGEPLAGWIKPPEFYEDVLERANAAYLLFDCKRPSPSAYGAMVTYRGHGGLVQMRWVKIRALQRWATKWEPVFLAAYRRLHEQSLGSEWRFGGPLNFEDQHER